MRPFTLRWWMQQKAEARSCMELADLAISQGNNKMVDAYLRYMKLEAWIYQRIITKYGEDEPT